MTSSNNPMAMLMNMMRPQMPQMQSVQSQNQPIDKERFMTGVKQLSQSQLQNLVQQARRQGISDSDIEAGLKFILGK